MLRDGSYAWEIKDFLVSQDRCADVTLEGQVYPGKGGGSKEKNKTKQEKDEEVATSFTSDLLAPTEL